MSKSERMLYNGQILPWCQHTDVMVLRIIAGSTLRCGTAFAYLQITESWNFLG